MVRHQLKPTGQRSATPTTVKKWPNSGHYAFLVTETAFDEIFGRVRDRNLPYWSDPMHRDPNRVNAWDDGRGVYFHDPDGDRLEIITRPYGGGGTEAQQVHPLVAPTIEPSEDPSYPPDSH